MQRSKDLQISMLKIVNKTSKILYLQIDNKNKRFFFKKESRINAFNFITIRCAIQQGLPKIGPDTVLAFKGETNACTKKIK